MASLDAPKSSSLLKLKRPKRPLKDTGLSEATLTEATRVAKTNQTGFIARLHAFLPPSFTSSNNVQPSPVASEDSPPIYLKTRIVTWNMHDSLPKGNLEDLLGTVPEYHPRTFHSDLDRLALPNLSIEEGHPYHIIVIAGQECPTLSGIPMGLAASFRHKDKDNHKDIDSEDVEKRKHKARELVHRAESLIHKHVKHNGHSKESDSSSSSDEDSPTTSGWSAVLEDWFANGVGSMHNLKPVVTAIPPSQDHDTSVSSPSTSSSQSNGSQRNRKPSTIDVNWLKGSSAVKTGFSPASSSVSYKKGPYELLIKDRLMGIYMAIYVHRDVRPLIQGVSSDTVPTGLIGGRLGNKGGVAISVKIHETTLLFLNAHLAAHEGKAQLRVANLTKIKNELDVDTFLSPDDPRTCAEDPTEKYDHTFIFGDLNFRLDISRLHADWLMSRKEYAKALSFDQLKRLIKNDAAFKGFCEGDINFPPTFKYDVQRRKGKSSKKEPSLGLEEVREGVTEHWQAEDSMSSRSSSESSVHSKQDRKEDSSLKKSVRLTAIKAKAALVALIHPHRKKRRLTSSSQGGTNGSAAPGGEEQCPTSLTQHLNNQDHPVPFPVPNSPLRTPSQKELPNQSHEAELSESEKGVYDSSTKQRVPSWCDRILWKTRVNALEVPEDVQPTQVHPQSPSHLSQISPVLHRREDEPSNLPCNPHSSSPMSSPRLTRGDNIVGMLGGQKGAKTRRQNSLPGFPPSSRRWFTLLPRRADTGDSTLSVRTTNESSGARSGPSRWWPFKMMTRDPQSSMSHGGPGKSPPHRKGDVTCLNYRTLDDRQMRRLEGLSDHRPVIGSYAVYI